jgi:hypothetical protein
VVDTVNEVVKENHQPESYNHKRSNGTSVDWLE